MSKSISRTDEASENDRLFEQLLEDTDKERERLARLSWRVTGESVRRDKLTSRLPSLTRPTDESG